MPFNTRNPVCFSFVFYRFFLLSIAVLSGEQKQKQGRELVEYKLIQARAPPPPPPPPVISFLTVPRRLFCFIFLVVWLCSAILVTYKNRKKVKINV